MKDNGLSLKALTDIGLSENREIERCQREFMSGKIDG